MRSIATPKEIIDMMTRMNAMALATRPMSPHILIKSISPLLWVWNKSRTRSFTYVSRLLKRKIHRDGHDDRHGHAVEQCWRERPLLHGVERRLVEQWNRPQHLCVLHATVGADGGFDNDNPGYPR